VKNSSNLVTDCLLGGNTVSVFALPHQASRLVVELGQGNRQLAARIRQGV
jgi:hypothetical protein